MIKWTQFISEGFYQNDKTVKDIIKSIEKALKKKLIIPAWAKEAIKDINKLKISSVKYGFKNMLVLMYLSYHHDSAKMERENPVLHKASDNELYSLFNDDTWYIDAHYVSAQIIKDIMDRIVNDEFESDDVYYVIKEYFSGHGLNMNNNRMFNTTMKLVGTWIDKNFNKK